MSSTNTITRTEFAEQEFSPRRFEVFTERHLDRIDALRHLSEQQRFDIRVVANVLPFRVNRYAVESLVDWSAAPNDPLFRLLFPQREMLDESDFTRMADLLRRDADRESINNAVWAIREKLNPHPADQLALNRPTDAAGQVVDGIQHKYRETVLFFPSQGQTCHSYCTFCFRWAQFVGDKALRISSSEARTIHDYLRHHREVTDLLVTGGDPMVMKTRSLAAYLDGLVHPDFDHVQTIRIGTKSLSFWPHRYVTDPDADDMLRLLERLVEAGKHVSIMAHYNHWRELEPDIAREAIRRLRDTGVAIRSQGPLLNHINNDAAVWARLWNEQVKLGIAPYYMFVERDTGAQHYFEVPLSRAWEIYRAAMSQVSGLGRTARGPSMSASPGKVEIQGVSEIHGEKVFVCRFVQGRNPEWVQQPFFARYDDQATWFDDLQPALGESSFFFEKEFREMVQGTA